MHRQNKSLKIITAIILVLLITQIFTLKAESTDRTNESIENEQTFKREITLLKTQNMTLQNELKEAQDLKDVLSDASYIGEFEITYYTANFESTGKNPGDKGYGITKSGEPVKENYTAATDWSVLPKGTIIYIEGVGIRVSTDTGGAIKGEKIDVFEPSYDVAMEKGRHMAGVYVIKMGEIRKWE